MAANIQECLLCSTELKTQNCIKMEHCCDNEVHEMCIKNMIWDSPTDDCPICGEGRGEETEVGVRSKTKINYPVTGKNVSNTMKDEPVKEDGKCYICLDKLTTMAWVKSQICCKGIPTAHLECLKVRNKPNKDKTSSNKWAFLISECTRSGFFLIIEISANFQFHEILVSLQLVSTKRK